MDEPDVGPAAGPAAVDAGPVLYRRHLQWTWRASDMNEARAQLTTPTAAAAWLRRTRLWPWAAGGPDEAAAAAAAVAATTPPAAAEDPKTTWHPRLPPAYVHHVAAHVPSWTWALSPDLRRVAVLKRDEVEIRPLASAPAAAAAAGGGRGRSLSASSASVAPVSWTVDGAHAWPVWRRMAWSADGALLAIGRSDGTVLVYQASDGTGGSGARPGPPGHV